MLPRALCMAVLVALVTACSAQESSDLGSGDPDRGAAALRPEVGIGSELEIVALGIPDLAEYDGEAYDYPGAARAVLNLYAEVLHTWRTGEAGAALDWTVADSAAASHTRSLLDRVEAATTTPEGTFTLRDFELGAFSPQLFQVDFCLDQRDTTLVGASRPGAADLAAPDMPATEATELLWMGVGMEHDGERWRAYSISLAEAGADTPYGCTRS